MGGPGTGEAIAGTPPWGSDELRPVAAGRGPRPNPLDSPFPTDLSEGDDGRGSLPRCSVKEAEVRIEDVLTANGFDRTGTHLFEKPLKWKGREYIAGTVTVWGERNLRLDATRERGIRVRMYSSLAIGAALLAFTIYYAGLPNVSKIGLILLAFASATPFAMAMISLGQDSFWSEVVTVLLTPDDAIPPAPPLPPVLTQVTSAYSQGFRQLATGRFMPPTPPPPNDGWIPPGGWSITSRAAVVRTTNWASKTGSGRKVSEAHREPGLSGVLTALEAATEAPLPLRSV